jgi:hypothetical protein
VQVKTKKANRGSKDLGGCSSRRGHDIHFFCFPQIAQVYAEYILSVQTAGNKNL